MMSPADLPSRMSTAADANERPGANRKRRVAARLIARRIVVKGLLGLSLPAALLTTSLPSAPSALSTAPAAAFAVASTTAGVVGDAPLTAAALDEIAAADVLSGSMDFGAPNEAPSRATTNEHAVNLRSGPGTKYAVLANLTRGSAVSVVAKDGSWYKVTTASGKVGWILGGFLALNGGTAPATASAPATSTTASRGATTSASNLNLRKGPGTAYGSFGKLAKGSPLALVARAGEWIQVRSPRGTLGWVHGDYVAVSSKTLAALPVANVQVKTQTTTQAAAPAAQQQAAVPSSGRGGVASRVAMAQVGRRYVWGGASPRGFDCSGLVMYAYRQAGLALPHSAKAQFSTRYGARINSMGALRAGDIVFFANTAGRGITHSALYIGGGRMVTANSPRTGVVINSINTRYWRAHFAGAIRPY